MMLNPNMRSQVLPMPVVLISTVSKACVRNAAPWGCITPILRPLDEILIASWLKRDTLNNIRETREFVVNVPRFDMVKEVEICARNFPPDVDEFSEAGFESDPSVRVKPPRIKGCVAWMECVLVEEILREKYSLIIGKVVHLEGNDDFFNDKGEMEFERARPMSMIFGSGGVQYTHPTSER